MIFNKDKKPQQNSVEDRALDRWNSLNSKDDGHQEPLENKSPSRPPSSSKDSYLSKLFRDSPDATLNSSNSLESFKEKNSPSASEFSLEQAISLTSELESSKQIYEEISASNFDSDFKDHELEDSEFELEEFTPLENQKFSTKGSFDSFKELNEQDKNVPLADVIPPCSLKEAPLEQTFEMSKSSAQTHTQAKPDSRQKTPPADFSKNVEEDLKTRFGSNLKSALGEGTMIDGTFSFETPVRIDGSLTGEIKSASALIVGKNAQVNARIKVGALIVIGSVEGEIEADDLIEVRSDGILLGDVITKRIAVEEGAIFNGSCTILD